jgi:dephospho-CoA kinase
MASGQPRWVLTGGIGSGKSEVRRILGSLGFRTIDADAVGHRVLLEEAFGAVSERWPEVVVDGAIDRKRLGGIVFQDIGQLRELEGITHPFIFGRIEADLQEYAGTAVVEMPLIEGVEGWMKMVVDSEDPVRIERVVGRGMARDEAMKRMAAQPSRARWLGVADMVVPNHGDLEDLVDTVSKVAEYLSTTPSGRPDR